MKKLTFLFLIGISSLLSQTAVFPNAVVTDQQLGVAANGVTGLLNNSVQVSDTSLNIKNGSCTANGISTTCNVAYKINMFVTTDSEIMRICSLGSATGVTVLNLGSVTVGSSCPSISGRGLDGTQITAHSTITGIACNSTGTGCVRNNIIAWNNNAKNKEIEAVETNVIGSPYSVKSYGAICDNGVTDDRIAIQAAIDAVGSGTLTFPPDKSCGVSSPGVYLYPLNAGMTLIGYKQIHAGIYSAGAGGGLVAFASNPPVALLTIFAPNVNIRNIYLDGNNLASANGIISVMGINSTWDGVISRKFSGDGAQIFNQGTPSASITSGGTAGSSAITVSAITNNRLTFGATYCTFAEINYGITNPQFIAISSVAGSVLNLASPLANNATTVRCHGNSNTMNIKRYASYANGGWGFHVIPGSDDNAIWFSDGSSNNNGLGGELWAGNGHIHLGGNYQGDGGPAVQLGDTSGATTHFMTIGPLSDIEENLSAYNAVIAVCDDSSQVQFTLPQYLIFKTGASACAAYSAGGTTTTGFGTSVTQDFTVKNASGTWSILPSATNGYIRFYDNSGNVLSSLKLSTIDGKAIESAYDVPDYSHAQFAAIGVTNPNKKLMFGFNTTTNKGFIQSTIYSSGTNPLLLNPGGGSVSTGSGGFTVPTSPKFYLGANTILTETGANNALVAALLDSEGTAISLAEGLRIQLYISHSLQAGANTLTFNGTSKSIVANSNFGNNITPGFITGSTVDLLYSNGLWQAMGR